MDNTTDKDKNQWMSGVGPDSEIVLSSRVRLARNLEGIPFPYLETDLQAEDVLKKIEEALMVSEKSFEGLTLHRIKDLDILYRYVMVEKHLISPLLAKESEKSAVFLKEDESVSIMVNEEDHLRIQCFLPGLQLDRAWEVANSYDDILEEKINYSFDEKLGYLTTCPTNVGTGIRSSVMVHLPGLAITEEISRLLSALSKVGLAVRGLYGEGTNMLGNIVQISNQITLGQSEREIIQNLHGVTRQIIEQEERARQVLLNENRDKLSDRAGRALGLLKYARLITSEEAIQLFSDLRLGLDLKLVEGPDVATINRMMFLTRPANLQKITGRKLASSERNLVRAEMIREQLKD